MLNIYGYINHTGYGQHCKNFSIALAKVHPEVCLSPISGIQDRLYGDEADIIYSLIRGQETLKFEDPCLIINMAGFLQFGAGKPRIGFPVFEASQFTPSAMNQIRQLDYIFVPTQWAKKIILDSNIPVSTYVVNEGINPDTFNPAVSPHTFYSYSDYYTFINVGKYEPRKSQTELIEAFAKAFDSGLDKVQLFLHAMTPFIPSWRQELASQITQLGFDYMRLPDDKTSIAIAGNDEVDVFQKGNTRILVNLRMMMSASEMASLYQSMDCGIFPSKAEGWDLPLMEMMAVGKPCIATNWTGHTEYTNNDNCILIKQGQTQIANDGLFFKGNMGSWVVPSIDEMVEHMTKMYLTRGSTAIDDMGSQAAKDIAEKYTWDNAALEAADILEDIL